MDVSGVGMAGDVSVATVRDRLEEVRLRIGAAGGDPDAVTVVAVAKGFGPDAVEAAVGAGLSDVGENYAQELLAKADGVAADTAARCRWHFIGHVQRNKIRALAPVVHLWQTVDRLVTGQDIAHRAPGARVLVQVNVSGEDAKNGCGFDEASPLVEALQDLGLDVRGLMAVGPGGPPQEARPGFRRLAALADQLGLPERSMGMTDDLEVAVQEGTTMVRVGRALFGPRPGRPDLRR